MTYNPLKMSKKILLIYSSVDGHTLKICKHMMAKNKSLATMNIRSLETVTPQDLDSNEKLTYKIVGKDEADLKKNLIFFQSPIGKGLIGKNKNDLVEIKTPSGEKNFEIEDVKYL